jgi:catechol 2,3-dioxygenase-like lactoylglutathione lyase family enzyme
MAASLYRVIVPSDDLEVADAFWSTLLQLEVDPVVPTRHYLHTAGAILALVDPREHGRRARPSPDCVYLRVPDLEEAYARAQQLGAGMLQEPHKAGIAVRPWGHRSFYCADPLGNPVCLIDDASDTTPETARYAGSPNANLSTVVLPARSLGRSDAFYEELLGLDADASVPGRHSFYCDSCVLTLVNTVEHARQHELPPAEFRPNPELVYFAVSDLGATWERAGKLGMDPLEDDDVGTGIQRRPWGERSFYGCDPSGNPICFVDDTTLFTGRA